ncbi:Uma2 family endonuclease [Streptomyces sp. NPDC058001]|uniref:Uma2 family endonuclease n=1 Tax=Streptomyces sp. NPDC058001 TaxID=3346300 RepID=UPI0036DFD0F8
MTVAETDRIEMADGDMSNLDDLFEQVSVPEGYKAEIVGGTFFMTPQRAAHWEIIRRIVRALEDQFGMNVKVLSDVRIDFPGDQNIFCPDVALLRHTATQDGNGRWHVEDIEFITEVISRGTAANDYGPKKVAYAEAGVPVYLIADPYQGRCHLYSEPKDGDYTVETTVTFGRDIDLGGPLEGLTLATADFPRD